MPSHSLPDSTDSFELHRQAVFDSSSIPMWIADRASFRFFAVNESFVRVYGYSRDEILTMSSLELLPPDEAGAMTSMLKDPVTPERLRRVWHHRKKDGALMQVAWAVHPTTYQDRPAVWVTVMDVTDREQIMQTLREREEHLRLALQAADMSAWSWQVKTDRSTGDDLRQQMFGVEPGNSTDFMDLIHPDDRPHVQRTTWTLLVEEGVYRLKVGASPQRVAELHGPRLLKRASISSSVANSPRSACSMAC